MSNDAIPIDGLPTRRQRIPHTNDPTAHFNPAQVEALRRLIWEEFSRFSGVTPLPEGFPPVPTSTPAENPAAATDPPAVATTPPVDPVKQPPAELDAVTLPEPTPAMQDMIATNPAIAEKLLALATSDMPAASRLGEMKKFIAAHKSTK